MSEVEQHVIEPAHRGALVGKITKRPDRAIKIVCIICLGMTIAALMVARNSPATAYETSIYTATPFIVWAVLIINAVCGIGIVVHQVASGRHAKDNLWLSGLGLILLSYATVLSLWIIRGYALWCDGDPLNHLGNVKDLLASGSIDIVYPVTHIYLAQISSVCDISPVVFHNVLPVIFALFFVAFMYLWAKSILPNKGQVIMTVLVSVAFIMGTYVHLTPNRLANLALPLVLFVLARSYWPGTISWKLLFMIMIFWYPTFHPVPTFFIIVVLLTILLLSKWPGRVGREISKDTRSGFRFNFTASAILVAWALLWLFPYEQWTLTVLSASHASPTVPTEHTAYDYVFVYLPAMLRRYGGILIYTALALAAIAILRRRIQIQPGIRKLASFSGPLIACLLIVAVSFFVNLYFNPFDRLQSYVIMLCTPFVGFLLYEMLVRAHQTHAHLKKIAPLILTVFLVALATYGTYNVYESPFRFDNNYQITRTEIEGMDWFLHQKDKAVGIGGISIAPGNLAGILLTTEERSNRSDTYAPRGIIREELRLPSHLGYDEYSSLGELYAEGVYLVLNAKDRMLYHGPLNELGELTFLPQDFEKMNHDPTTGHIYSNGGMDVYVVLGTKSL